jgi:hypothetical protein
MTIQPLLLDVIRYMALGKIENIAVSTTASGAMQLRTFDPDRDLIITGVSKQPQTFAGEFGLFNFKILKGLLAMKNFQTEDAKVDVATRTLPDGSVSPDRIEFKAKGSRATFRLMSREVVPDQPEIGKIPWDLVLDLTPSKIAEFAQMANLYAEVDPVFALRSEAGALVADFGNNSSSTHSGSMTLLDATPIQIAGDLQFRIDKFLLMLKTAAGAESSEVRLCSRGLLGVSASTDQGTYDYMLKKSM